MERHREQELASIRAALLAMGVLVRHQVEDGCGAVFASDLSRAQTVIATDAEVDAFDTRIQKACMDFLALGQPFAMDLRLLLAMLSINAQLERVGDIAVNVAERTSEGALHQHLPSEERLAEMVQIAQGMLEDSLGAFEHGDAERARRVIDRDAIVDTLDRETSTDLVERMKHDPEIVEVAVNMLAISKQVERLADHATNIAEEVVFMVDARIIKHTGAP